MVLVTSNVETVAVALTGLSASDAAGPLPLTSADDARSNPEPSRHWHASRATSGPIIFRYRAPISETLAPRGAAPPIELRSDTGTFSGQGKTFLALPETDLPWHTFIRWDLSQMGTPAAGVSSLGLGDISSGSAIGLDSLADSFFMAGNVHLYPAPPPPTGFFAAWYGKPPYDLEPVMASEQKLYQFYEGFFHRPSTAPYGVFMRENLVNAGGGVSLGSASFVTTFGPKTDLDELKITLAHEMLHTFVGGLDGHGDDAWYAEGLAVYYARLLALRAGQITPDQFLADLNFTAGRYYTDALIDTPNSEISANFWADTRIRVLPYDRGSMYFAIVDGGVRAASGGKQSLDDLVLAMLDRKRRNLPADEAAWRDQVKQHLGEKGIAEFDAMLAGAIMLPPPDGFGPCFTRIVRPLRRYQLGFDPKVLIEHRRIVRGLVPGSAAELAGVRNGDEITKPVPQDLIQGHQNELLTLELMRAGKPLTISYLPRGETVEAFQWTRTQATNCGSI
jgi:predicted metalloprotease with PDZ domain